LCTIRWAIEDDDGVEHTVLFPESLYVPDAKVRSINSKNLK